MDRIRDKGDNWRVGVLFSQTGVTSAIEQSQLNATRLAIEEINSAGGVLDRLIEPVIYDPASDPKQFRALAERLFQVDRIRLLFGCYMSSTRKAVLPVVESHRGLLFYPTLYEGFEYSRHCIYTGCCAEPEFAATGEIPAVDLWQSLSAGRLELHLSLRVQSADGRLRRAGHAARCWTRSTFRLLPDPKDFDKVISRIKKTTPDVIFSTVVGKGTSVLYEAYRDAGFDPAQDADREPHHQRGRGRGDADGGGRRSHHRGAVLRDLFLALGAALSSTSFKKKYGPDAPVTAAAEAAYFQVHLAMRAVARCGSDDPEQVLPELRDSEFDAPQGRVRIDPENNHTYLWPRIARLDKSGQFQTVWNPGVRIKPDPYCVVQSLDDWSADDLQTINH